MKAEDNLFPYVTLVEGSAPAAPAAGRQKAFIDSADHKLKRVSSAGTVTTIEGGSSGATTGYPPGSADIPPVSANAKDDEFDGTSLVTWTNGPTAPTTFNRNSTRAHHAFLRSNGNTTNAVVVYQSTPSTPFTITTKIAAAHHGTNNYASVILTTASPTGSSPLYIVGPDSPSATTTQVDRQKWNTFATSGFSSASAVNFANTRGPWYIKVVVNSTTSVDSFVSTDGYAWVQIEAAFNPGFTIGSMGLGVVEGSGPDMSAYVDFFRIT